MIIAAICGWGLGTSIMLKANIEEILSKHNLRAKVFSWDAMSFKSQKADIIVASEEYKLNLKGSDSEVVILSFITDMNELERKLLLAIQKLNNKKEGTM